MVKSNKKLVFIGGITTLPLENDIVIELCRSSNLYKINRLRCPKLLLVGHYAKFDEESGEIDIFGGGANCFSFGTHLNPLISKLTLESIR